MSNNLTDKSTLSDSTYIVKHKTLSDIANSIRVLSEKEDSLTPSEMVNAIASLFDDCTATADTIVYNYSGYSTNGKVVGTIPIYDGKIIDDSKANRLIVLYTGEEVEF